MFPWYSVCTLAPTVSLLSRKVLQKWFPMLFLDAPQNISGFVVLYYWDNYYWLNQVCFIRMTSKMYFWGPPGTGLSVTALHYSIEIRVLSGHPYLSLADCFHLHIDPYMALGQFFRSGLWCNSLEHGDLRELVCFWYTLWFMVQTCHSCSCLLA